MLRTLFSAVTMLCIVGEILSVSAHSIPIEKPPTVLLHHEHTGDCDKTAAEPVQIICIFFKGI